MRLRVTRRAATQIERALDYIEAESPQDANRMRERFRTLFLLPAQHPRAGQAADLPGVQRLSAGPYPYLVFHRVTGDVLLATRLDRPAQSREPASARLGRHRHAARAAKAAGPVRP